MTSTGTIGVAESSWEKISHRVKIGCGQILGLFAQVVPRVVSGFWHCIIPLNLQHQLLPNGRVMMYHLKNTWIFVVPGIIKPTLWNGGVGSESSHICAIAANLPAGSQAGYRWMLVSFYCSLKVWFTAPFHKLWTLICPVLILIGSGG